MKIYIEIDLTSVQFKQSNRSKWIGLDWYISCKIICNTLSIIVSVPNCQLIEMVWKWLESTIDINIHRTHMFETNLIYKSLAIQLAITMALLDILPQNENNRLQQQTRSHWNIPYWVGLFEIEIEIEIEIIRFSLKLCACSMTQLMPWIHFSLQNSNRSSVLSNN